MSDGEPTLAEHEAVIERGRATFVETGGALRGIRDRGLYRESHATFEEYCWERWGFDRTYAHRLMAASAAVEMLPVGNAPKSEAVARELAPLRSQPEAMREAWSRAVEEHGPAPTAAQVREVVRPEPDDRAEPDDREVAARMADWLNRLFEVLEGGGAFVFGDRGRNPEPRPGLFGGVDPDRIVFGPPRGSLSSDEMAGWLRDYRAEQAEARELRDRKRGMAHFEAQVRRDKADSNRGFRTGPFNCPSCGWFKPRPSARCEHCGDELGTHNGDQRELDRDHGYA
jgi:hypothetical protein